MPDPFTAFLRACARATLDERDRARIATAAASVEDWTDLVPHAEYHGLTPLVWHHALEAGVVTSAAGWRELGGLVVRHRDKSREQVAALGEISDAFAAAAIPHVVLKGAALAHLLYPRADVRPMGDLDLLVRRADAARAQAVLADLGFKAAAGHGRPTQRLHHHVPIASRPRNGVVVNVEIHHDALSRDQPGRLRLDARLEPTREIAVAGRRLRAFGHRDMLTHLCAHVLEPADRTRLVAVADFVGYAARYAAEIDWAAMRRDRPRVVNALGLMHYLTPLPASLAVLMPPETAARPRGVGRNLRPLSTVVGEGRVIGETAGALLYPSEWWMRGYYAVPPGRPLFPARWGRHLWRIVCWSGRRMLSASLARE